jgi:hypothetical protein
MGIALRVGVVRDQPTHIVALGAVVLLAVDGLLGGANG